jgi:hypothetical protein
MLFRGCQYLKEGVGKVLYEGVNYEGLDESVVSRYIMNNVIQKNIESSIF